ncbi:MAG TPA: PAS domain S-box protein, partial [Geobacteraceae bacterium]|nr:PAS domain S-box protein [Geobacteraceae bacterium]
MTSERGGTQLSLVDSWIEAIFRASSDLFFQLHADGTILDYKAGRAADLYLLPEQFLGKRMQDVLPPQTGRLLQQAFDRAIRSKALVTIEYSLPMPAGEQFFEARLLAMHDSNVIVLVRNISEFRKTKAALQKSEKKFAKVFHAAPVSLAVNSLADGKFVEVNETFERVFGYRAGEIIGRGHLDCNIWAYPDDRARMLGILHKDGKVRDLQATFIAKTGEEIVMLYSAEIIELGDERCLLSLANDVTIRKRMEGEIEILNTDLAFRAMELETANRDLESFNYTVTHDLRTPLTVIKGYCQVLQELRGDCLGGQGTDFVREIEKAAQRMDQLITTLLDFSCLSRSTMVCELVDLTVIANDVASQLQMMDPLRQVIFAIATGVKVQGDAKLLRVVLENLIGNAWKYTGRQEHSLIEFGAVASNDKMSCFVRDNGPGFAAADADKLFQAFQRLPGSGEFSGHGIGLAT